MKSPLIVPPTTNRGTSGVPSEALSDDIVEAEPETTILACTEQDELPIFRHWPTCIPVTNFSEEMFAFLNSDLPPTRFRLVLRYNAEVSLEGLTVGEKFIGHEEAFIAVFDGTLGIIFRSISEAISAISNLSRWDETRPSPKVSSLKTRQNEIRMLCDLTAEFPKPLTHRSKDNVTTFGTMRLQLSRSYNTENPSKVKVPSLPRLLSSTVPEEAVLLSFLHVVTLPDNAHVIEGVAQTFTSEVPAPERKLDGEARLMAFSGLSALSFVRHAANILEELAQPGTTLTNSKGILEGVGRMLLTGAEVFEPVLSKLVEDSKTVRRRIRTQATSSIIDTDIKSRLLQAPIQSPGLFSEPSVHLVEEAVLRPAPREIKTKTNAPRKTYSKDFPHNLVSRKRIFSSRGGLIPKVNYQPNQFFITFYWHS